MGESVYFPNALMRHTAKQGHNTSLGRNFKIRSNFGQRNKHERSLVHPRMRQNEFGIRTDKRSIGKQIQVQRTGRVDNTRRADTTETILDHLQPMQQIAC